MAVLEDFEEDIGWEVIDAAEGAIGWHFSLQTMTVVP